MPRPLIPLLAATTCLHRVGKVTYVRAKCVDLSDEVAPLIGVVPGTWAVDGAPGGTTGHGLVTGDGVTGVYTAPATRFASSAARLVVAVSVQAKTAKGKLMLLVSNITILTGCHVVGNFHETNSGHVCAPAVSADVTDLVTISVIGKYKIGSCSYLGVKIGIAGTYDDATGVAFHTADVPPAGSLQVASDTGDDEWTWTVTVR